MNENYLSVPFVNTFIWKMPHHHKCTSCCSVIFSFKCPICDNISLKILLNMFRKWLKIHLYEKLLITISVLHLAQSFLHLIVPFVINISLKIMLNMFRKWLKNHLNVPFVTTFVWKMPHHHKCTSCCYFFSFQCPICDNISLKNLAKNVQKMNENSFKSAISWKNAHLSKSLVGKCTCCPSSSWNCWAQYWSSLLQRFMS